LIDSSGEVHLMAIRLIKILLSLSVALWGIAAGAMNLVNYGSGVGLVGGVLTLEGHESIRAIHAPIAFHIGFAFIYLGKLATGLLCAWGTYDLWTSRRASAELFDAAKSKTVLGCGVALFMLFFGFVAVAGAVFHSTAGPPSELSSTFQQGALLYMAGIALISLYVSAREPG
jgi:predicted small integral membrane protein